MYNVLKSSFQYLFLMKTNEGDMREGKRTSVVMIHRPLSRRKRHRDVDKQESIKHKGQEGMAKGRLKERREEAPYITS